MSVSVCVCVCVCVWTEAERGVCNRKAEGHMRVMLKGVESLCMKLIISLII